MKNENKLDRAEILFWHCKGNTKRLNKILLIIRAERDKLKTI